VNCTPITTAISRAPQATINRRASVPRKGDQKRGRQRIGGVCAGIRGSGADMTATKPNSPEKGEPVGSGSLHGEDSKSLSGRLAEVSLAARRHCDEIRGDKTGGTETGCWAGDCLAPMRRQSQTS
jgi:hypothetical protein